MLDRLVGEMPFLSFPRKRESRGEVRKVDSAQGRNDIELERGCRLANPKVVIHVPSERSPRPP